MNSELLAPDENEEEPLQAASTESTCMELGAVSKDTHGAGFFGFDGGIGHAFG